MLPTGNARLQRCHRQFRWQSSASRLTTSTSSCWAISHHHRSERPLRSRRKVSRFEDAHSFTHALHAACTCSHCAAHLMSVQAAIAIVDTTTIADADTCRPVAPPPTRANAAAAITPTSDGSRRKRKLTRLCPAHVSSCRAVELSSKSDFCGVMCTRTGAGNLAGSTQCWRSQAVMWEHAAGRGQRYRECSCRLIGRALGMAGRTLRHAFVRTNMYCTYGVVLVV